MKNNRNNLITLVVTALAAVATISLAIFAGLNAKQAKELATQANQIAVQANEIAKTATTIAENNYRLYYETNLPHISAILQEQCDDASKICYDALSIQNTGGPIKEAYPQLDVLMRVRIDKRIESKGHVELVDTYLPLYNYFLEWPLPTGNAQGLIFKPVKADSSEFRTILSDFYRAASEDKYLPDLSLYIYLRLDYEAVYTTGQVEETRKYFYIDYLGSREKEGRDVEERIAIGRENSSLAADEGFFPMMGKFDGGQLWEFCKKGLLPAD